MPPGITWSKGTEDYGFTLYFSRFIWGKTLEEHAVYSVLALTTELKPSEPLFLIYYLPIRYIPSIYPLA